MRCPKCHYISFDSGERCRNCGYEFALAADRPPVDLPLRRDEPIGPYVDLSLQAPDTANQDLPLFGAGASRRPLPEDAVLISAPAVPRAPLAVRRPTPDPARLRHRAVRRRPAVDAPTLDLPSPADAALEEQVQAPAAPDSAVEGASPSAAPPGRRLAAALVDAILIAAVDLAVLYFTLQLCGLTPDEWHIVPVVPFMAFLLVLDGGYVVSLTAAGGQTLGKMLAGLQVVTGDGERIGLGPAMSRAGGYLVSALPAGLGFLPAFFSPDRRALHDRIAHTKVVMVRN